MIRAATTCWFFIAGSDGKVQVANASTRAARTLDLGLDDVQQAAVRP